MVLHRSVAVAVLTLSVGLCNIAKAEGAFPGRDGRLFFTAEGRGFPRGVYSLSAGNPSRPKRIVACPRLPAACPDLGSVAVAPEGRRLAFEASGHLYVASTDGRRGRRLPDPRLPSDGAPIGPYSIAWSPRGNMLAIVGDYEVGGPGEGGGEPAFINVLVFVDVRRGTVQFGTRLPFLVPIRWSSANRLVYSGPCLLQPPSLRLNSLRPTCIAGGSGRPLNAVTVDWAPDGTALAYDRPSPSSLSGRAIDTVSLRTRVVRRVTRDGISPVWSPSGQVIAFLRGSPSGPTSLWTIDRRKHAARRILTVRQGSIASVDWQALPKRRGR